MTDKDIRHRSKIYDSMVKSPNRAMLRATGMTDKDFETPIVGLFSTGLLRLRMGLPWGRQGCVSL